MAKTHELKTDPEIFPDVLSGAKTFEVRYNDRDFQVGDTLILKETDKSALHMYQFNLPVEYTGREYHAIVTYILEDDFYGLQEGFVVMGIKPKPVVEISETEYVGIFDNIKFGA